MATGRLIIICGLPGSGKTTLARYLEAELSAVRFCPDEWMADLNIDLWDEEVRYRVEQLQWKVAERILALGQIAIIEWGTWGRSERDTLRLGARAVGAAVELHFVDAPIDELLARVTARGAESPPITRHDLVQADQVFQRPTQDEVALFDPPVLNSRP